MKRHSFKLMLLVLVLVLSLSTVVLAACNKGGDGGNNNTDPVEMETLDMFNEIVSKIGAGMSFGESFGTDISAAVVIDDKTATDKDVTYRLTAKGNVNGKATAKESDTNFLIELTEEKKGAEKKTLLGIAYEAIENEQQVAEPFFFINLGGSSYTKINGYSLAALYRMTQDEGGASATGNAIVDTVISTLVPALFGENGTVANNVYTLNFDIAHTINSLLGQGTMVRGLLEAFIPSDIDLNAIIAGLNLSFTDAVGATVAVEDLDTLVRFFNEAMHITGTLNFAFDSADKFMNANTSFDYNYGEANTNCQINVEKANIGAVETPINTFEGFALTQEARKTAQAFNALNFSLNGVADGINKEGQPLKKFVIDVQSDIDAFELLNLLNGTDKANILATLEKLGYFHLTIDEVNRENGAVVMNILTLHSNFSDGYAVLGFALNSSVMVKASLGGVYDFDALIDYIGIMNENSSDEPSETPDIMTTINNIVKYVKDFIGFFDFDNMKEDGLTIDMLGLGKKLLEVLNLDIKELTGLPLPEDSVVPLVLGGNSMNIKLSAPTFGTCSKVEANTLRNNIRQNSNFANKDFIKEVKAINGASLKVLQNDSYLNSVNVKADLKLNKAYPITGVNLNDEDVSTSGYIIGVKGLNTATLGPQNVTVYVAIANDIIALADLGAIPLQGVLACETTIEVVKYENQSITPENLKIADQNLLIDGETEVFDLIKSNVKNPIFVNIDGIGIRVADASMLRVYNADGKIDVTATAVKDGVFAVTGSYKVKLVFGDAAIECGTFNVENVLAERADGKTELETLELGGSWTASDYKITMIGTDGKSTTTTVAPVDFYMGTKGNTKITTKINDYFDVVDNVYTLKKDLALGGQIFKVEYAAYTTPGGIIKKHTVEMPISDNYKVEKAIGATYFLQQIAATIKFDGVSYALSYKSGKWVLAADGAADIDVNLAMTWAATSTAVEFNENGSIKNYPNTTTRSNKVNCAISIGDYIYNVTFNVSELQASNISSRFYTDSLLDGKISNIVRISYYKDGQAVVLEFKYGSQGYAIYEKGTDNKVYDVTMTITDTATQASYTLTDGKFADVGTYKVEYSITINGINQNFSHTVKVIER